SHERKREKGRIGSRLTLSSHQTNDEMSGIDRRMGPSAHGSVHDVRIPSVMPNRKVARPPVNKIAAGKSKVSFGFGVIDSRRMTAARRVAAIPMGTLIPKIQRHEVTVRMNPPRTMPKIDPEPQTTLLIPKALPRSLAGKASERRANELARSIAPPIPWSPRKITSSSPDCARPHRALPRTKTTK